MLWVRETLMNDHLRDKKILYYRTFLQCENACTKRESTPHDVYEDWCKQVLDWGKFFPRPTDTNVHILNDSRGVYARTALTDKHRKFVTVTDRYKRPWHALYIISAVFSLSWAEGAEVVKWSGTADWPVVTWPWAAYDNVGRGPLPPSPRLPLR